MGTKGRLDYERERMRDFEREREMELDRRAREGDQAEDRPFASLREIELEEAGSTRRLSEATTLRKNSLDFV